jgi:arylformamidase
MKIYDISSPIKENMTVYKNNEANLPEFIVTSNFSNSTHYETRLSINLHSGTHIDAPLHMIENGVTIDKYNLENFIIEAKVIDFTNLADRITKSDLEKVDIKKGDFIIFKTKNSFTEDFDFEFTFLEKSGAEYLRDLDIIGVGTDALGIERAQPNHETHVLLLNKGIIILEGLRLKDVPNGTYTLIALPLKIENVEAAPTRAILIDKFNI